jgi:threonine dehydrogenase-like Zn-dependent dehydrogenase
VSSSGLSSKARRLSRGVDKVPHRLAKAEEIGVNAVEFTICTDIAKRIKVLVSDGFDVAIDASTFHEPKTAIHKTGKALSLETDVSETLNETFSAVKKMGRVGIIAAYAGYTNGSNIGTVMEKGIRLIRNGQGKLYPISLVMQSGEKIT